MPPRPAPATRTPRTGRRPGASGSREAILAAARRLFAEQGYTATSMRAIAAEAGVDAALIVHFFATKARLLAAAIRWPFDPAEQVPRILTHGREGAGEQLARLVAETWEREGDRDAILTLLRAASAEPAAAGLLREFLQREVFRPLLHDLGADDAELRAGLAAAQLMGFATARYVLRIEPLAAMGTAEVVAWLGPGLQRALTGELPTRAAPRRRRRPRPGG